MKAIRFSDHALRYTSKRGFTVAEIEDAIRTSPWTPAELGRLDCRKNFPYGREWNGKVYAIKLATGRVRPTGGQVRPIFVEEAAEIVVITIYTYYFDLR